MAMCSGHWAMVPRSLKNDVWRWYRPGQEKVPGSACSLYMDAYKAAIAAVNDKIAANGEAAKQQFLL